MSASGSKYVHPRFLQALGFACAMTAGLAAADGQPVDSASAAKGSGKAAETTFGGYGEIAYNGYLHDDSRNQVDLKRFVLFFGHSFNDRLSFNSEVEWEHAVTGARDEGESEIEQAYLNYQFSRNINVKMGLFLMPFGLLNKSHEPPVYSGVERNEVETRIIPTTWREGGIGLYGGTGFGLAWDIGSTTGFDVAKFEDASAPLAGSHQELQFAKAASFSFYAALNYIGLPGFLAGGSAFTGNSFHDNADFKADATKPDFSGIDGRVTLWDLHTRWQQYGADVQAVYARGMIDEADRIDAALQNFNAANADGLPYVPQVFDGWLAQAGYTFWFKGEMSLTPFARYEGFDTQAEMPGGFSADAANSDQVLTAGFSFKPVAQVSLKADYRKYRDHARNDRFNAGLGYMF